MNINLKKNGKFLALVALGLVAIIVIAVIMASVLAPKKTPVSAEHITVTIDGDVSAAFTLANADYTLIDAKTFKNSDLYTVDKITASVSFTQAMDTFVSSLVEAQKLTGKEGEVVLFAVESRNEKDFEALAAYFRDVLKKKGFDTRVYALYIKVKTDSTQELADKYNVSYAKAHLCVRLEKENRKLKAEDLITLSLAEIVKKANVIGDDDLIGKVESDTNEEQKNEFIPEDKPSTPSSGSSSTDSASSDTSTSSDTTSSDTSSDTTSSDTSSDSTSSDGSSSSAGPSFVVSNDNQGWLPGLY